MDEIDLGNGFTLIPSGDGTAQVHYRDETQAFRTVLDSDKCAEVVAALTPQ